MNESFKNVLAEPGVEKPDPICTIQNLKRSFGGLNAVDVKRLEIQRGSITSVIGPNGAGKTTLFNIITGFESADEGTWTLNGYNIAGFHPYQIARIGMTRTFQITKTLDGLSVMENLLLASQRQMGEKIKNSLLRRWHKQEKRDTERALEILEMYGLLKMKDEYASTLSGGQRKLLEISRAMMCEPRLILLDEPLAGVNPALVDYILEHIRNLPDLGMTVVLIEHNMDAVVEVSDWIVCLSEGGVIAEGTPRNLIKNQVVIDAYLGN